MADSKEYTPDNWAHNALHAEPTGYWLNAASTNALVAAAEKYHQTVVTFGVMEPGAGPFGLPEFHGIVVEDIANLQHPERRTPPTRYIKLLEGAPSAGPLGPLPNWQVSLVTENGEEAIETNSETESEARTVARTWANLLGYPVREFHYQVVAVAATIEVETKS